MSSVIQLSPTLLNTFRQVTVGEWNLTAARLVEYLTGQYQINKASSRGWAYHQMIEHGPEKYRKTSLDGTYDAGLDYTEIRNQKWEEWYEVEDWRVKKTPWTKDFDPVWVFKPSAAQPAIDEHNRYAGMINEPWVDYNTTSQGHDIRIRMRLDGLNGATIEEYKTSKMKGTYQRYQSSLQWRCYLQAVPDAVAVNYTHIQIGARNDWAKSQKFTFTRADYSPTNLQGWIDQLVGWLMTRPELLQRVTKQGNTSPLPF